MAITAQNLNQKSGYKQTEVGVIPADWEAKTFGEVMTGFTSGATPSRKRPDFYKGNIRWITSGELNYNVIMDTIEKISVEAVSKTNLKLLPKGTFLIAITGMEAEGTRGSCGIVGAEATTNQHCMALFPTKQLATHYLFHYYVFKGKSLALQYCQGTKQQDYTGKIVKLLPILLPPLPEQRAIATTLSDVDALIASLDRLIAKKRDIKQATMQQLLTGKTRLPGFSRELKPRYKQTEVGLIPEDWEPTPLGLLSAFITKGATPTTYGFSWVNDGVLFLRSECVSEQGLDLTQSMFITPEAHNILKRGEVRAGDILITITGNVGRAIYLSNDFGIANINQHIARIRIIDINVAADYVFHFLSQSTIRKYYGSITTGQAYPQISLKQVRDTRVPIPPTKAEQQAIAAVLSDMDAEIAALEQKRDKTRALKQGMMQELLTGKTRLI